MRFVHPLRALAFIPSLALPFFGGGAWAQVSASSPSLISATVKRNSTVYTSGYPAQFQHSVSGATITLSVSSSASKTKATTGIVNDKTLCLVPVIRYTLTCTGTPPAGKVKLDYTRRGKVVAIASTSATGASAQAIAKVTREMTLEELASVAGIGGYEENPLLGGGWSTAKGYVRRPTTTWSDMGNGTWTATVDVPLLTIDAFSSAAFGGTTGGNSVVATASSDATQEWTLNTPIIDTKYIAGTVNGANNEEIHVEVANSGGVTQLLYATGVDGSGNLDVDMANLSNATYRVYLKARGSLRKRVDVAYTTAGVTGVGFTLLYGDVDDDNDVDQDDLDIITLFDGKSSADNDWYFADSNGVAPYMADLDRDGDVDQDDYDIADANDGEYGD